MPGWTNPALLVTWFSVTVGNVAVAIEARAGGANATAAVRTERAAAAANARRYGVAQDLATRHSSDSKRLLRIDTWPLTVFRGRDRGMSGSFRKRCLRNITSNQNRVNRMRADRARPPG